MKNPQNRKRRKQIQLRARRMWLACWLAIKPGETLFLPSWAMTLRLAEGRHLVRRHAVAGMTAITRSKNPDLRVVPTTKVVFGRVVPSNALPLEVQKYDDGKSVRQIYWGSVVGRLMVVEHHQEDPSCPATTTYYMEAPWVS